MLTHSSLSKPGPRQRAGRPALGWRVGSRRLPEHDLAAQGARTADAPLAGDFPVFPAFAAARRRHFRRHDTRCGWGRDFPHFPLVRYPLSGANEIFDRSKQGAWRPMRAVFQPFTAVFDRLFGPDESKIVGESIAWQFRRFFHRLKTAKTVETAPHRIDGAIRSRFIRL